MNKDVFRAFSSSCLLAGLVEAVLVNVLDLSRQLSGVPEEHRSVCHCQLISFWSPVSTTLTIHCAKGDAGSMLSHTPARVPEE